MHAIKPWLACMATLTLVAGCGKAGDDAGPRPATVAAGATTASASVATVVPAAPAMASVEPVSSDPDNPVALPSLQLKGAGAGKAETRYYAFDAGAGAIVLTATAKNAPSGATQALGFALYDLKANRLCFDSHGNTTEDKTVVLACQVEKAQPLLLRLDLSAESLDYSVGLAGPVTLPSRMAAQAMAAIAGAGSTDIDEPTRLQTNRVKADGSGRAVSYYYAFNAGPGELVLTGDGSNTPAAMSEALRLVLYTLRSERLCELALGNTTLEKRAVTSCVLDVRQPVILRADLAAETVAFRARFDGPYDFAPFTVAKEITIALDSSVMFDTGKSTIKPEAAQVLHEAAERITKFAGASVLISGHTDTVGDDASNRKLSTARAEAVKEYLITREKIAAHGLLTQGFGSSRPVADNGAEPGRARNRRVDVVITPEADE